MAFEYIKRTSTLEEWKSGEWLCNSSSYESKNGSVLTPKQLARLERQFLLLGGTMVGGIGCLKVSTGPPEGIKENENLWYNVSSYIIIGVLAFCLGRSRLI